MLTRYGPCSAVRQLRDEMNRAFGEAAARTDDNSRVVTGNWTPAVDVREAVERFVITADVPGVDPKDIEVTADNGVLTIKGERKPAQATDDGDGYRRVERLHGTFYRRFSLPDTADAEQITARGDKGVLEVVVPKKASVQPKRIPVAA